MWKSDEGLFYLIARDHRAIKAPEKILKNSLSVWRVHRLPFKPQLDYERTNYQLKMAGKRKRDSAVVSRSTAAEDKEPASTTPIDTHSHDVFRKFFEAQFQPIEPPKGQLERDGKEGTEESDENDSEESESGSEWGGLSGEDDGDSKVEVVEHRALSSRNGEELDKKARKAFMVCLHHMGLDWFISIVLIRGNPRLRSLRPSLRTRPRKSAHRTRPKRVRRKRRTMPMI